MKLVRIDRKAPGRQPKLDDSQRQALAQRIDDGPTPAVDGVVRWRLKDLARWLLEEFGVCLDESSVSRELKALGFRKLTARPRHHALAMEAFKKTSPPRLASPRM